MREASEYKRIWRFFTIADYIAEERWLNEMATEGWDFVRIQYGCRFTFRRGTPGRYIYKLDMVERTASDQVRESYFNFLTECGIRVVGDFNDWIYLQKQRSDGPFDTHDDAYARLRVLNKVYSFAIRTLCRLMIAFTLIVLGCTLLVALLPQGYMSDMFYGIQQGVSGTALLIITLIWVPITTRLRRRMNAMISDIGVKH